MKNQPNKATVKDGLPTANEILDKHALKLFPETYTGEISTCIIDAMQSYSDQQNAEMSAKIAQLESSYAKFAKERAEQYGEYIDLNVSLRNENAELRERVKELEFGAQVDSDCIESQSNEIDELKAWKESAMAEAEKLDIQSIGMEIGCKLGSSIPEQVLPWIREQKAKIASYESSIDGLKKVVDSLVKIKSL